MLDTSKITPEQLAAIGLRYSSNTKPLKIIAFADIASKGLFLIGKPAKVAHLKHEVGRIIGRQIDEALILEALETLKSEGKVYIDANKWALNKDVVKEIEQDLKSSEKELSNILGRHFPGKIDEGVLTRWFVEATAEYFGYNGAELVKAVCRNVKFTASKQKTTKQLLERATTKYKLSSFRDELVQSFNGFLSSEETTDQRYIKNLIFAMFSSQLVAAETGADPITIDEIKDATFILDTNILFAVNLEIHRLAKSMKTLGLALSQINSKLLYLHVSEDEYKRVVRARRSNITTLFDDYPSEVVEDAQDDFIKTAKYRGSKTKEDFERFFDEIKNPPARMRSGPVINKLDNEDIEKIVKKAEVDASLKAAVKRHFDKLHPDAEKPKSDIATEHDTIIMHVVDEMRKTDKHSWIITLDRSLHNCAVEQVGSHSLPNTLTLEGLIQILAVNHGGPSHGAADFVPLLTNLMMNRCNPPERAYTPQDLQILHVIQERASDFMPDKIKIIANVVNRHRLAGASADDPKMQREVNVMYQDIKRDYDKELEEAKERVKAAENESRQFQQDHENTKAELAILRHKDLVRKARLKILKKFMWRLPVLAAIGIGTFHLAKAASEESSNLDVVVGVLSILLFAWPLLANPIKDYLKETREN